MDIKKICYQIYKMDWEEKHHYKTITSYNNYCCYCIDNGIEIDSDKYSFDEYLFEVNGEIYFDYDEFLDYEYPNYEYMKAILTKGLKYTDLFNEYLKDINSI